jgi:carbon-monoxide dehydrogenase medium subunit
MLCEFEYLAPASLPELLDILAAGDEGVRLLAGGTDLLVNIRAGLLSPKTVVNIKKVAGFAALVFDKQEGLAIGPAVTVNELARHADVREQYPLLAACAETLASYQLRNRATVIGNIVNASPCADMSPALLCYKAEAVLASKKGSRKIALENFFTGVKKTVLAADEVVEKILIPAKEMGGRGAYAKLKRIKGHDPSMVGVALHKKGDTLRFAVGSVAPTPILIKDFKTSDKADDIVSGVSAAIKPIDDIRSSRAYREFMVKVYVRRLLEEV